MRIAVLSGKGGTGKTFISANLAYVAKEGKYIDCDVEEPNGWLFLKPELEAEEKVEVMVPVLDEEKCIGCRKCVEFCKFNALAYIKDTLLVFSELCHACGGCVLLCPTKALTEEGRAIGRIEYGKSGMIETRTGILNTGEATGVPLIKKLFEDAQDDETIIIDCPPGSSCAVMESIRDSDYCVFVAEPTLFGVHNLSMVYDLVKLFNKPHGVVLNKTIKDEMIAEDFCKENNIPIIMRIPYEQQIGLLNSQGKLITQENPQYYALFEKMLQMIKKEVSV